MTNSSCSAYDELSARFRRADRFAHLASLAQWDQASMMPSGGAQARAEALAEVGALCHGIVSDPQVERLVGLAKAESLGAEREASVREMEREFKMAAAVPERVVEGKIVAGSACERAWREQRPANDWSGFLTHFKPVVDWSRQEAQALSQAFGLSPYDAVMAKYEPGMQSRDIDVIFGQAKQWLPGLARDAIAKQATQSAPIEARGPFPADAQRLLGLDAMELLGFDFERGRLDASAHPFCGGVPQDVRITTRYREDDFAFALMGVIHETGHARYEQGLPASWAGLPVGRARSMGVHESQSLLFEMQLGAHPGFLAQLSPMIQKRLGEQDAFSPENLAKLYTRVRPTLLRLDADEITYPSHIILRYEIERDLINGDIEPEDIPALWDEKMMSYLGLDSRGNHRDGAMQDIHWTDGSFGYFPSYTLGAMSAAQFFAAARRQHPDLDESIHRGDFSSLFAWLASNVWSQASLSPTPDLMRKATGSALDPAFFKAHLERRYLG
jgi:carboxypeptidase Taq